MCLALDGDLDFTADSGFGRGIRGTGSWEWGYGILTIGKIETKHLQTYECIKYQVEFRPSDTSSILENLDQRTYVHHTCSRELCR